MSDKQDKIKKMIEMQKAFMEFEHANGVDPEDYFMGKDGTVLEGYRQEYRDLAMSVVEDAHKEVGSER